MQRSFFPTGLGMTVMARTLWDASLSFDTIASDYYAGAFGEDGDACHPYLARLSELFHPPYLRQEEPQVDPAAAARFESITGVVEAFRPVIARNLANPDPARQASWQYLQAHADFVVLFASALAARAHGDNDAAGKAWDEVAGFVQQHEMALQPVLDVYEFIATLKGRVFSRPAVAQEA